MGDHTINNAVEFSELWCSVKLDLFRLINSASENTDFLGSLAVEDFFLFENLCKEFAYWG